MARYNYIFSHDDPRRRRGSKTQRSKTQRRAGSRRRSAPSGGVYVPETGQTFRSAGEAARALGVDSSNVSKVLSGKRKTAGGFHFQYRPWSGSGGAQRWLEESDHESGWSGSGGKAAWTEPEPEPEIEEPEIEEPSQTREDALREQIKEKVDDINRMIEEARKRKREGFLDDLNDLHDFAADILGETGDNLIDDQSDVLDDMDLDELEQLNKVLSEKIEKARSDVQAADDRLSGYADAFGVSSHEMEQYEDLIPEINRTLDRAQRGGAGSNLWYVIKDAIARGVDPDDLRDLLNRVNNYFDNPQRGQELRHILREWEDSVYHGQSYDDLEDEEIY